MSRTTINNLSVPVKDLGRNDLRNVKGGLTIRGYNSPNTTGEEKDVTQPGGGQPTDMHTTQTSGGQGDNTTVWSRDNN